MSGTKTNLAFKITNWCNLQCRHCCENSGPNQSPRLMNLDKMKKYLDEFNALPIEKYDSLVFTGGEVMAPYYHGEQKYIPKCLKMAIDANMLPILKTNGLWGNDKALKDKIFSDIESVAYNAGKLIAMDISVDRFHNNLGAVANIINDVVRNSELGFCLALTIQGIHKNSTHAVYDLYSALLTRGIRPYSRARQDDSILLTDGQSLYPLYYNFKQSVANTGRARANKLGKFELTGKADIYGDCVMIDGNDVLRLNNVRGAAIHNRPIGEVIQQLKNKEKQH